MKKSYSTFEIEEFEGAIEIMRNWPKYTGKRRWWEKHDMPFDPKRPLWKRIFNVF
ncbi:MAG: hypothetical protein LBT80_08060 [Lactobacillaceae bacterium]|jgi:hypothetical protein|nr:hypothetical protein [Lactobacillaceae bacterium]